MGAEQGAVVIDFATGTGDEADAIAVGVGEGRDFDATGRMLVDRMPWLESHLDEVEFTGESGQSVVVLGGDAVSFRKVAFLGIGDGDVEQIRRAAGTAGRQLSRMSSMATTLHLASPGAAEAVGLGITLGSYTFHRHKSETKPSLLRSVVLYVGGADAVAGIVDRLDGHAAGGIEPWRQLDGVHEVVVLALVVAR